jgi:hypothetical protein
MYMQDNNKFNNIYKNCTKIIAEWNNLGKDLLTAIGKVWQLGCGKQ